MPAQKKQGKKQDDEQQFKLSVRTDGEIVRLSNANDPHSAELEMPRPVWDDFIRQIAQGTIQVNNTNHQFDIEPTSLRAAAGVPDDDKDSNS